MWMLYYHAHATHKELLPQEIWFGYNTELAGSVYMSSKIIISFITQYHSYCYLSFTFHCPNWWCTFPRLDYICCQLLFWKFSPFWTECTLYPKWHYPFRNINLNAGFSLPICAPVILPLCVSLITIFTAIGKTIHMYNFIFSWQPHTYMYEAVVKIGIVIKTFILIITGIIGKKLSKPKRRIIMPHYWLKVHCT